MEGLVNYSSEDEQDDMISYSKGALRERGTGASTSGRSSLNSGIDNSGGGGGGPLKRRKERSRSESHDKDSPPHRKGRDAGGERERERERERYRSGNTANEDKHKSERRTTEKLRGDGREKRDSKDARSNRDDNGHKHDYKKHEDYKRYRDPKRDIKRDSKDYNRDDKRYSRNEDRKAAYTSNHSSRERFNTSKPRYDDRKPNDDRTNDERRFSEDSRRSGGASIDDRKRDFNDRRSIDDRKSDRRNNNEDRRPHRSFNEDRSHTYRPKRSGSPVAVPRNSSNKYDRDENYTKRDRRHQSRSKTPPSPPRSIEKSKERDQQSLNNFERAGFGEHQHKDTRPEVQTSVNEKKTLPTARNFEALLSLNLSEASVSKQTNILTKPDINSASNSNNPSATTVQLPSYYNPNVINPNKYVEQMQKRKLIWGAKKAEDSASKWGHAQFSQDQDGKVASKFMRLMGIKSGAGAGAESSTSPNEIEKKSPTSSTSPSTRIDVKSREAMFSTMEQQYEVARQVTHTMRGVGLGFGSQPRPY